MLLPDDAKQEVFEGGQASSLGSVWKDELGRPLRDLRISVTDRCNFRCGYCMPRAKTESRSFLPRSRIIDFEEITRLARLFVEAGVRKLRLTGGEPLLRRELPELVAMLRPLKVEIALTTNGVLLPEHARALRLAGLDRLTVSLDALDNDIFQRASDAPAFAPADVLKGIEAAERAGFSSININCVVRRGLNESQVLPIARHFAGSAHVVRFIEYMDVGTRNQWEKAEVISETELRDSLSALGELRPLPVRKAGEVARRYGFANRQSEIGFIASVTQPFCRDCCRARLSADGRLYSCLFASEAMSVFDELRSGVEDEVLSEKLRSWWGRRKDRYSEERGEAGRHYLPIAKERVEMSYIGG